MGERFGLFKVSSLVVGNHSIGEHLTDTLRQMRGERIVAAVAGGVWRDTSLRRLTHRLTHLLPFRPPMAKSLPWRHPLDVREVYARLHDNIRSRSCSRYCMYEGPTKQESIGCPWQSRRRRRE